MSRLNPGEYRWVTEHGSRTLRHSSMTFLDFRRHADMLFLLSTKAGQGHTMAMGGHPNANKVMTYR